MIQPMQFFALFDQKNKGISKMLQNASKCAQNVCMSVCMSAYMSVDLSVCLYVRERSNQGAKRPVYRQKSNARRFLGFWGTSKETKKLGKKPAETLFGPIFRSRHAWSPIDFFSLYVSRPPQNRVFSN